MHLSFVVVQRLTASPNGRCTTWDKCKALGKPVPVLDDVLDDGGDHRIPSAATAAMQAKTATKTMLTRIGASGMTMVAIVGVG